MPGFDLAISIHALYYLICACEAEFIRRYPIFDPHHPPIHPSISLHQPQPSHQDIGPPCPTHSRSQSSYTKVSDPSSVSFMYLQLSHQDMSSSPVTTAAVAQASPCSSDCTEPPRNSGFEVTVSLAEVVDDKRALVGFASAIDTRDLWNSLFVSLIPCQCVVQGRALNGAP